MKRLSPKRKRQVRNLSILAITLIAISGIVFLILWATHVFYYDNGFHFSTELFSNLRGSFFIIPIFIAIQATITTLLCFVPGTSAVMIGVAVALFGTGWRTFLIAFVGVVISSILMDTIGRFGGSKLVIRLIGQDDYDNAMSILREKTYTYLPFMYLLPLFPDDALCFVAGATKIKWWYHYLIIVLFRGIGVATIVFGIGIIPYQEWLPFFDHIYDWFLCGGAIVAYILALLKLARYVDRRLTDMFKKRGFIKTKEENQNGGQQLHDDGRREEEE